MLGFAETLTVGDLRGAAQKVGATAAQTDPNTSTKGFIAGTKVATTFGWQEVEALHEGDQVLTFDNGPQTLVAIRREPRAVTTSILVPECVLGNDTVLRLAPCQTVLVEAREVEERYGDPFAILKARALVGFAGITYETAAHPLDVYTLYFGSHEVLQTAGGARLVADAEVPGHMTMQFLSSMRLQSPYESYSGVTARSLVAAITRRNARLGEGGPMRPAA